MTQKRVNEIVKECLRQEESCLYTAASLYEWQKKARLWKNVFIVVPIVAGGLATSQIITNADAQWAVYTAAVLALFAGLFPAVFEALGMDMRVREIGTSASEFTNLRDRFRILARLGADMEFDELNPSFEQLMDRMDAARTNAPPVPKKYFEQGRKKIDDGDYKFKVDTKTE